jgi:ABC-2 type transport system ATP-binding protein
MGNFMSSSTAIRLETLSKTFGRGKKRVSAVKNLNLEIETGQVFGFLGPNGAGKTTTIRMMMDLVQPTRGSVAIFGREVHRQPEVLNRVGAMVENPMFYGYMNGQDNLEVLSLAKHSLDSHRIASVLDQVGLIEQADRKVSGYSTGMKQRLGIAAAMLNDPDLLILDEPTNGLDPGGIQEMRKFIRRLVDSEGKTVFISSHQLSEVEQICECVAIINRGEIIRFGSVSDLLTEMGTRLRVQVSPLCEAARVLEKHWEVTKDDNWLVVNADAMDSPKLTRKLVGEGINVHQILISEWTLEDYFMAVTRGETDGPRD